MKYGASEDKLTPAARQVLDTLAEEYRNEVLLNAERMAMGYTGQIQEISVQDIVEGASRLQSRANYLEWRGLSPSKTRLGKWTQLFLRAYRLTGVALILIGLVYLVYTAYVSTKLFADEGLRIAAVLLGVGIMLIVLTYLLQQWLLVIRTSRSESSSAVDLTRAFVTRWQEVETAARELAAIGLGESAAAADSIADLMLRLQRVGVISAADEEKLRKLLSLRNEIVHRGSEPSERELLAAIKDADRILAEIRSQLA